MISFSTVRNLLVGAALIAAPSASFAGVFVGISVGIAPPPLPVYVQPPLPAEGYIWTPGYWAYGPAGYYWVPGVWVQPPSYGLLWTPGYWGFAGGVYGWHGGYWGPHVGFYGGVNYGFGYGGIGFAGGEWHGNHFAYNSAVNNFGGVHVTNVYRNTTIVSQTTIVNNSHTSFNGPGGVTRQPSVQERQFASERHVQPTPNQTQHETAASQDRGQLAAVNHGRPATAAASSPAQYHQVAQQHMQSQPISAADRTAGKSFNAAATNRGGFGGAQPNTARPANAAVAAGRPAAGNGAGERPAATPRTDTGRPMASPAARPEPQQARPQPQQAPRPQAASRPQPQPQQRQAPPQHAEGHPKR